MVDTVVIVSGTRTPIGSFGGKLSTFSAIELGAQVIRNTVEKSGLDKEQIDEVFMGNVLSAGLGQAPTRQALIKAGLSHHTAATTVSKVCGSGMKAIFQAYDGIRSGSIQVAVAGGMESMSNAPYLLSKARFGYRMNHQKIFDHMFLDGLEDGETGFSMGLFAQEIADRYNYTRQQLDEYAIYSLQRAKKAIEEGVFKDEITPVHVVSRNVTSLVEYDEQPLSAKQEKIAQLKPVFKKDGTITAANSSSISDGAAALLLCSAEVAKNNHLHPLATIVGTANHAQLPLEFSLAPIAAIDKLLKKVGWTIDDVELWEINEAFASVALLAIDHLKLDVNKVNIFGGACALGHPIGCSGTRIVLTLITALQRTGAKKGIAAICIGGGEATAIAIELNS
ncbi:thiolase family protein [Acinetobacter puyangensis]|uniref:thiolase family protein n=1 Tax=Acinetobacter puyangensis TaxID=1096779 RepID=UPI003A4D8062